MSRRILSVAALCALAACGGGGAGGTIPPGGSKPTGAGTSLKITLSLPAPHGSTAIARGRHYISYASNAAVLTFYPHGATFTEPLAGATSAHVAATDISEASGTGAGKACTDTAAPARTCTLTVPIESGLYDVELSFWDAVPANATTPPGHELSVSSHVQTAITRLSAR